MVACLPRAQVLAEEDGGDAPTLAVLDRGATQADGSEAAGRRVFMPWGDNNFSVLMLTHDGRTLLKRAIEWATQGDDGGGDAYGVATIGQIKLIGAAKIDSFDSSQGAYGVLNHASNALVVTNGTSSHIVQLIGAASVQGDIHVGPGANANQAVQTSGGASVTGTIDNLSNALDISVDDPGISGPVTDPDLSSWGSKTFGSPGSTQTYHWNELTLQGAVTVHINGPVRALVEGDVNLAAGSTIDFGEAGSLELYVKGDYEMSGNAAVNVNTAVPSKFQVYMLDDGDVNLTGNSHMYGTIVGPQSDCTISGNADLFGLFHGNTLQISGSGALHHDVNTTGIGAGSEADDDDENLGSEITYRVTWVEQ